MPPTADFHALAALRPRIGQVERDCAALVEEMARLRLRSAAVLQRWYQTGVLAGGDAWVRWEERLEAVEKAVRRQEVLKEEES